MLSSHPVIEYLLMLSLQSFPIKKKILKKEEKIILKNWKALWSEIHIIFFLTFNTVNVLKLVHSISSASIYSDHEDLFTFITMIVHLHCQHNVILHVLKIIVIHVYCLGC